jgi:CHASE3 domain sensor protein
VIENWIHQTRAYLAPYDSADDVVGAEIRVLRDALADDAPQLARLDILAVLADARIEELSSTIALRDSAGLAAAAGAVRIDEGRRLMDEIARVAEAMESGMNARLAMLREVTVAGVLAHANRPERDLAGALEVLRRFLEQSERVSSAGFRHALTVAER